MSINQTQLYDALQSLTQQADVKDEFIYGFLDAYGFAKSTITQIRNGAARNVARGAGDVGLKSQLYFHEIPEGENIHEAAERLKEIDAIKTHKIRFVIVTNFIELVAYDLKADERMETSFTDLHQHYTFFLPLAGLEKSYTHTESVADVKAAEKMGRLFDLIRELNDISTAEEVHALNVFLTRLLFCFFAEDTGIFDKHQFSDAIRSNTREDGEDVAEFLGKLFEVLNAPDADSIRQSVPLRLSEFPYVNGGLFAQKKAIPDFGAKSRRLLLECSSLDWSQINPDIFGSMFQAVIDEDQRGTLGQHYTSVSNIMKVIKPLFLDKLYAELERSRTSEKKLQALLERISSIKVFDPACGSGNFLIIAYKEFRRFEMEVFRALNEASKQRVMFMTGIKLSQFYGIEIDDFAHEIALLSLWLAEHQMNIEFKLAFGECPPSLPLKAGGNISLDNACRISWDMVCEVNVDEELYLLGNPPYLGGKRLSTEQSADMDSAGLKELKQLDYICCWFIKASEYIKNKNASFAFVSTSSISQGEQVHLLWPNIFGNGQEIFFAYEPFKWTNNARDKAGVVCTIVGVRNKSDSEKIIFHSEYMKKVGSISPYLIEGDAQGVVPRSTPLSDFPAMCMGSNPVDGKNLILSEDEYLDLIRENPEAISYLRRYMGGDDFLRDKKRYCIWISDLQAEGLLEIPFIVNRISACREYRLQAGRDAQKVAGSPYRFCYRTHKNKSAIIVPKTTSSQREYLPCGITDGNTVINVDAFAIYDVSPYVLGFVSSKMHNVWLKVTSGRLGEGYRYSTKLTYNTFPLPDFSDEQRREIDSLAEEIILTREDYFDSCIADLYDSEKMPSALRESHQKLDLAIEKLYRSKPFKDDVERLEHLFARYEMLVEQEHQRKETPTTTKKPRTAKTAATEFF